MPKQSIVPWLLLTKFPALFFFYFRLFQTNITMFRPNKCEMMSILYAVLGFEPTTFGT